jgi:hypothetical protein
MFRSLAGFKARYDDLTLLVVSEFDEWKVLVFGPGVTLHGHRQFGEAKAKDHAAGLVRTYLKEVRQEELPEAPALEWTPTAAADWLVWRA